MPLIGIVADARGIDGCIRAFRVELSGNGSGVRDDVRRAACGADYRAADTAIGIEQHGADSFREFSGLAAELVMSPARLPGQFWNAHGRQNFVVRKRGGKWRSDEVFDADFATAGRTF